MTAWNDSTISQQFGEIPYKPPCLPPKNKKANNMKCKKNEKGKVWNTPKEMFEYVAVTGAINQNIPEIETQI